MNPGTVAGAAPGRPEFTAPIGDGPIGVFDSGLGGLTVAREMLARMPTVRLVYIGDSANAPYGARSPEEIQSLSLGMARFLQEAHGVRGLVVACNTATAAAAETLRAALPLPVVGMEPAVKPAVAVTKTGTVGVLATVGTLSSARFAALLTRFDPHGAVTFLTQPCPGLPEAVEEGRTGTPETRALLEGYVRPLLEKGADTLVLGCTHYPVLRPLIAEIAGPNVTIIDTGAAVARRTAALFAEQRPAGDGPAEMILYTTGDPAVFRRGAESILGDVPARVRPPRQLHWRDGALRA